MPVLSIIIGLVMIIVLLLLERGTGGSEIQTLHCPDPAVHRSHHEAVSAVAGSTGSPPSATTASGSDENGGAPIGQDKAVIHRRNDEYTDGCKDGYHLSWLLSRYIDIDFIEFVLGSHPKPHLAKVVDIGIYEAGGLIHMAKMGFSVSAYEANPNRYNACMVEINSQTETVRNRINLKNLAVSDNPKPMCFQRAGLDSHMYESDDSGKCQKEKSIIVNTISMANVVTTDLYFAKIDTQGFDTRILDILLDSIEKQALSITFIHFEITRAKRTKEDHKKILRRIQDLGYDLYQGGAVQPWKKNHPGRPRKTPLAMLAVERNMPTCVDEFVDRMHDRERAVSPGKSSTDFGMWMDILAVKRLARSPYYRHTGWVLAHHM